jgi:hypothetical protein
MPSSAARFSSGRLIETATKRRRFFVLWKIPWPQRAAVRPYRALNNWSAGALCEVGLAENYRSQK